MNDEEFTRTLLRRVANQVQVPADAHAAIERSKSGDRLRRLAVVLGVSVVALAVVVAGLWLTRPRSLDAVPAPTASVNPLGTPTQPTTTPTQPSGFSPSATPPISSPSASAHVAPTAPANLGTAPTAVDSLGTCLWPELGAVGAAVWCPTDAGLVFSLDSGRTLSRLPWTDAVGRPGSDGWLKRSVVTASGLVLLVRDAPGGVEVLRYQVGRGWLPTTAIPAGGETLVLKATSDGHVVLSVSASPSGTFTNPKVFTSTDGGATFVDRGVVPASWLDTPFDLTVGSGPLAASVHGAWLWTKTGWRQAAITLPANETVLDWGAVASSGSTIEVGVSVCPPGIGSEDALVNTECGTRVARSTDGGGHFTWSERIPYAPVLVADGVGSWWAMTTTNTYRLRDGSAWTSTPLPSPGSAPRSLAVASESDAMMLWDPCPPALDACAHQMSLWLTSDGGRTWKRLRDA